MDERLLELRSTSPGAAEISALVLEDMLRETRMRQAAEFRALLSAVVELAERAGVPKAQFEAAFAARTDFFLHQSFVQAGDAVPEFKGKFAALFEASGADVPADSFALMFPQGGA